MSTVYGAEHLLRMLGPSLSHARFPPVLADARRVALAVSLPQMVAGSTMDPESTGLVRDYVNELMA